MGVYLQTADAWVGEDRMPVPFRRLALGMILVDVVPRDVEQRLVLCARVSSDDRRLDLDGQVARLTQWACGGGHVVAGVVSGVGSGLNGKRRRLRRILSDPDAMVVVVELGGRLACFGVGHLRAALGAQGGRIVVAEDGETTDDLVRDMIEVVTSRCARRYGRCGARNRAMRAVTAIRQPGPVEAMG